MTGRQMTFIRRTLRVGIAVGACTTARLGMAADDAPTEIVRDGLSAAEQGAARQSPHALLAAAMPSEVAPPIRVALSSAERRELQQAVPSGPGRLRIGMVKTLSPALVVAGFDHQRIAKRGLGMAGGVLQATDDGGFAWAATVVSPAGRGPAAPAGDRRRPSRPRRALFRRL